MLRWLMNQPSLESVGARGFWLAARGLATRRAYRKKGTLGKKSSDLRYPAGLDRDKLPLMSLFFFLSPSCSCFRCYHAKHKELFELLVSRSYSSKTLTFFLLCFSSPLLMFKDEEDGSIVHRQSYINKKQHPFYWLRL